MVPFILVIGIRMMLDWLHYHLFTCVYSFVSNFVHTTTDGHVYIYFYFLSFFITLFTVHLTNSLYSIYMCAHIRDWNRLPPLFDWSSSSQGASIFKRCFVACRHSSIEQKHAHDGPMNNTLMREIVPAVVLCIVCVNCLMSPSSIWRAPSIFDDKIPS